MSLSIGAVLGEAVDRAVSRNGLLLAGAWAALGALSLLAYNSALLSVLPATTPRPVTIGPALDVPLVPVAVSAALLYLLSFLVMAAALRTFVTDETETAPAEHFTRNLGWMLLNLVVGYVVFAVVVSVGFVLLIVPGVFLAVSLFFWFVLVVVEDQHFVSAFRDSWALTRGHRLRLFGLGLVVTVVGWILTGVPFALAFLLSPWVVLVAYAIGTAVYGVFAIAAVARAYVQLDAADAGASA